MEKGHVLLTKAGRSTCTDQVMGCCWEMAALQDMDRDGSAGLRFLRVIIVWQ